MRHVLMLALSTLSVTVYAQAASENDIEGFAATFEKRLPAIRYMEKNCTPVSFAGWDGFETTRCTYDVKDKKTGEVKTGLVVMLNPSARKLSAWILNACEVVRPNESRSVCSQRLLRRVLTQSGAQFPVAGIVCEDILPADGVNEAYGFANGVTSLLAGVQHRRTTPFSLAELEAALVAPPVRTASESGFARVVGVTRQEYTKLKPAANVSGLNWLSVVREEHKSAMKGDRNLLLEAWLSANAP